MFWACLKQTGHFFVGEDIILPQSFAMAHLIHRFAVPLPPLGKALIVDFRLACFRRNVALYGRASAMPFVTNGIAPPAFLCKKIIAYIYGPAS